MKEEMKENTSNNKIVETPVKTPRKRINQTKEKEVECSPPKGRKVEDSPGISDKLRKSLTIEEEEKPKSKSKYSSARRALSSNENFNLPGREEEIRKLKDFIDEAVKEEKSCSLYISGQPGTGKVSDFRVFGVTQG